MTVKDIVEQVLFVACPSLSGVTTIGFIDKNKDKTVGVYERSTVPVEGYTKPSYKVRRLTILVHWTKGYTACESKAQEIAEKLNRYSFDNGWVDISTQPVDVGRDDNEIFERTLDIDIYIKEE